MKNTQFYIFTAFFAALTLVLTSCGESDSPDPVESEHVFSMNLADGLQSLDPVQMSYNAAIQAGMFVYNGLVRFDDNNQIVPEIAKSWSTDSSGRIWTFVLRDDVKFHESSCFADPGSRTVDAHDVVYSITRACDSRSETRGFWIFDGKLRGATDFYEASGTTAPLDTLSGVYALNDSTVVFELEQAFAPFLSLLTMPYAYVIPREAVEMYGKDFGKKPVGTGPFKFEQWAPDVELTLTKNSQYFEKENGVSLPYLDGVSIRFIRDASAEFLSFQQGEFDILSGLDIAQSRNVFNDDGTVKEAYTTFDVIVTPNFSIDYYGMLLSGDSPVANNQTLRQALNYAIDRNKIVQFVLHGRGIPAHNGVVPPGISGHSDAVEGYEYDPAKAAELLAEAGYPGGKGLPTMTLRLGQSGHTIDVAEAVQQQWKEIGVQVELQQMDFPSMLKMVRNSELPLWRTSWIGDYPDPENFLALFYSAYQAPEGPNTTHFSSPEFDSLFLRHLNPTLSKNDRLELVIKMQNLINQQAPWIFLYYNVSRRLVQKNVHGLVVDGADRFRLTRVTTKH